MQSTHHLLMLQTNQFFKLNRRQILFLAGIVFGGNLNIVRSQSMTKEASHFISLAELKNLAAKKVIGESVMAGGGPRASLPVPVRREGQVQVAFMFCFYMFGPDGSWLWPPNKVAWLNPVDGRITVSTQMSPTNFGQSDSADKPLKGDIDFPQGMTTELFLSLERRLFVLYDALFATWAVNLSAPGNNQLKSEAQEFLKIFNKISEQPLRPYYNALGRDWFEWLRKLAE